MTLFSVGFRPFFLLAAICAMLPPLGWVAQFSGINFEVTYYGASVWHGHEMLFGYAVAVMAGFLLTAVRNWTGMPTAHDAELAMLALLWCAGRVAPFLDGLVPRPLIAALDLAFLPVLALTIAHPIAVARQYRNLVFPLMLAGLAALNAVVHAEALGAWIDVASNALEVGVLLAMVMIAVMGGRIIPRFTENGVGGGFRAVSRQAVERLAAPSIVVLGAVIFLVPGNALLPYVAGFAALVHAVRLAGWYTPAIWRVPLVWILQLGYAWLCVGLALYAFTGGDLVPVHVAMHALTTGTLGSLTLGMMARVSLGHTGRPILPARATVAAFVLLTAAALVRTFGFLLFPEQFPAVVRASAFLWDAAFACFLAVYLPVLVGPRVDTAPR